MTVLLLILLILGFFHTLFAKIDNAIIVNVSLILLVVGLYPSFTIGPTNTVISVVGSTILLSLVYIRSIAEGVKGSFPPGSLILIFFTVLTSLMNSLNGDAERIMTMSAQGALIVILILVSLRINHSYKKYLVYILVVLIIINFFVTVGEQFFNTGALWPRVNGTDIISDRPNSLSDSLIGRSLGTMSMMITLGSFCGVAMLSFIERFLSSSGKNKIFWIILMAATAIIILFSGTRSAVVSLIFAISYWLFKSFDSIYAKISLLSLVIFSLILIIKLDVVSLLGFSNFENTESFEHRFGVITSVKIILKQPEGLLFGHGGVGATDLLVNSLTGVDGLTSYDNMYVRELAVSGLVGLLLLSMSLIRSYIAGSKLQRAQLIYIASMGMSFDQFTWRIMFVLIALIIIGVLDTSKLTDVNERDDSPKEILECDNKKNYSREQKVNSRISDQKIFVHSPLFKR